MDSDRTQINRARRHVLDRKYSQASPKEAISRANLMAALSCCLARTRGGDTHLTGCIHESVSESQLPHKIVNFLFTITDQNIKLTDL